MSFRIAAIDIGTNTILMLVCEGARGSITSVLSDEQAIARLGKGVDERRIIAEDAFHRCEKILFAYREKAAVLGAERILITGTSALRDAANRDKFTAYMQERLGIPIEILSGEDEAKCTFSGAASGIGYTDTLSVLDIGGGSTEWTTGRDAAITASKSIDIGSVRLTERFLKHSPPTDDELTNCEAFIRNELRQFDALHKGTTLIGVAGTVTTMAAIDLGLSEYVREKVAGHVLSLTTVEAIFQRFRPLPHEQIVADLRVDPGRADIILAGVMIVQACMKAFGYNQIVVSERGLRYGIALRELKAMAGETASQ